MHEFSIAVSIVELSEIEARAVKATAISRLVLEIGTMAGIEFEALDTALDAAKQHTMLHNAEIVVEKVQAMTTCDDCGHKFEINDFLSPCPQCGGYYNEVFCGKELKIKSLVAET
ncbi:MAG: hydrogenase maturation nickel metallochaperone HypA [Bacteroidetes bacterium]|nr:hydrogenase maturation nickel metallochaperone HypA [Bacteroidota bacterium]